MGDLIFVNVLEALVAGFGLWLATKPTKPSQKASVLSVSAVALVDVISAIERLLGGKACAAEWLDTPNSDLDGRRPLDVGYGYHMYPVCSSDRLERYS